MKKQMLSALCAVIAINASIPLALAADAPTSAQMKQEVDLMSKMSPDQAMQEFMKLTPGQKAQAMDQLQIFFDTLQSNLNHAKLGRDASVVFSLPIITASGVGVAWALYAIGIGLQFNAGLVREGGVKELWGSVKPGSEGFGETIVASGMAIGVLVMAVGAGYVAVHEAVLSVEQAQKLKQEVASTKALIQDIKAQSLK